MLSPHLGEVTRASGRAGLVCAGLLRRKHIFCSILFVLRTRRHDDGTMARRYTARQHDDGTTTGQQRMTTQRTTTWTTARRERQKPAHGYQKTFCSRRAGCIGEIKWPFRVVGKTPPIRRAAHNRSLLVTPKTRRHDDGSTVRRPDCTQRRSTGKQLVQSSGNQTARAPHTRVDDSTATAPLGSWCLVLCEASCIGGKLW